MLVHTRLKLAGLTANKSFNLGVFVPVASNIFKSFSMLGSQRFSEGLNKKSVPLLMLKAVEVEVEDSAFESSETSGKRG